MLRSPGGEGALSGSASLWLDLLRLAAAQAVLLGHSFDFFGWFSSLNDPGHVQIQRLGVVVFFLLSGFLIPYSVDRKRAVPSGTGVEPRVPGYGLGRYLIDRSARIYSGLIPALLFIAAVDALPFQAFETAYPTSSNTSTLWVWIANALHLQEYPAAALNGLAIPIFGTGDPLWSLAVEWWLYMLFGVVAFRALTLPALALAVIASLSVAHNFTGGTGDRIVVVWILGWLVFLSWKTLRGRLTPVTTVAARYGAGAFGLLAIAAVWSAPQRSHFGLDLPFAILGSCALLLLLLGSQEEGSTTTSVSAGPASPWSRAIQHGAGYSFTLYLTHFSVLTVLYDFREQLSPPVLVAIAIVVCNGVAWLVSRVGERRTQDLKQWMLRRLSAD